jgi:hypothetical protein
MEESTRQALIAHAVITRLGVQVNRGLLRARLDEAHDGVESAAALCQQAEQLQRRVMQRQSART